MKLHYSLAFALLPAAACGTDSGPEDLPRLIAARGDTVVVAASIEEPETELRCGVGDDPAFGAPVLFVSTDRGENYARILPVDQRPLTHMLVHGDAFWALAQDDGGFAVLRSDNGRTWLEIASGTSAPHDFTASDAGFAVAHSMGVMTSADGDTWTDHALGEYGLYSPSVALTDEGVAVATADGTLQISPDNLEWITREVDGLQAVWQLIPDGTGLLINGTADLGAGAVAAIGRIDLVDVERAPEFVALGTDTTAVVTPAGLLQSSGSLSTIGSGGTIGAPAAHIDAFTSAAVDGNTVAVLGAAGVSISIDGGFEFAPAVALPLGVEATEFACRGNCGKLAK